MLTYNVRRHDATAHVQLMVPEVGAQNLFSEPPLQIFDTLSGQFYTTRPLSEADDWDGYLEYSDGTYTDGGAAVPAPPADAGGPSSAPAPAGAYDHDPNYDVPAPGPDFYLDYAYNYGAPSPFAAAPAPGVFLMGSDDEAVRIREVQSLSRSHALCVAKALQRPGAAGSACIAYRPLLPLSPRGQSRGRLQGHDTASEDFESDGGSGVPGTPAAGQPRGPVASCGVRSGPISLHLSVVVCIVAIAVKTL